MVKQVSPQVPAVSHYQADLLIATDYYPFGMVMAGRSLNTDDYRYGFNGKEFDQDWDGGGATYDYGFRIYDPRMCRFLSVDPLTKDYPELTPFQFASNTPIQGDDLDGLELRKKISVNNHGQTVIKLTVEAFVSDQSEFFSKKDFRKMRSEFKNEFKRVYSGKLDDGTIVHAGKAKLKYTQRKLDANKEFFFEIKNLVDKDAKMIEIGGDDEGRKRLILNRPTWGSTDRYGEMPDKTENNRFEVKVTMGGEFEQNTLRPIKSVTRTALHELGHSSIDDHNDTPGNLMNDTMTGDQIGGELNSNQLKKIVDTVKENK